MLGIISHHLLEIKTVRILGEIEISVVGDKATGWVRRWTCM